MEATGRFALLFKQTIRHHRVNHDATQTNWIFDVNIACQSLKYVMIMCPSTTPFGRQTEKTIALFNPTKADSTLDGVPSKTYSQGMFPRHFFDEVYRVLSGSNREVSAEVNQILSKAGFSLIFSPNEYYAG